MFSNCLSSLVERVEAVFSYVRDSFEEKFMSLSLSNQGVYFKAHPEIAQKTVLVQKWSLFEYKDILIKGLV